MAIVNGIFQQTGTIGGVTIYKTAGSNKLIMRKKGGPSKARMAKGKEFENVRKHQAEWGACVIFARAVRGAVGDTYRLSDFNMAPTCTGMGKKLMSLDTEGETGKRKLCLSTFKQALIGFSFNRQSNFNSILRCLPNIVFSREKLQASISYDNINTATDLYNPGNYPFFRLLLSVGTISDLTYSPTIVSNYCADVHNLNGRSVTATSAWLSTNDRIAQQQLTVAFDEQLLPLLTANVSVLLSAGIEFGAVGFGGITEPVKRAGAAKIIIVE